MKICFSRHQMLTAFGIVSGVAPARSPKPILQNIRLAANGDGDAELTATDLEVSISHRLLGVKCETPGSGMLSTQRFNSILRTSGDAELTLSISGDKLRVQGAKSEFNLTSADPDGFPSVPTFAATDYFVVSAGELKRAIRRTMLCCDLESSRYALSGVLFELTPASLRCVGTDGRRLAQQDSAAEAEGEPTTPPSPVVPQKCLKLLDKILDDGDPPVQIAVTANDIMFRTEAAVVHSRLVEGRFPKYGDVFPAQAEATVPLNVGEFHRAVEQAGIVSSEESRGVDFRFMVGELNLKATAADVGNSDISLPINYSGKAIEATFDPRYLADMMKVLGEEAEMTVDLIDSKNAAVFRTEDGLSYVVMPLSRDR